MLFLAIIGIYALSSLYILGFERRNNDFLFDSQPIGFITLCYIFAPLTAFCFMIADIIKILITPILGIKEIIEKFRS